MTWQSIVCFDSETMYLHFSNYRTSMFYSCTTSARTDAYVFTTMTRADRSVQSGDVRTQQNRTDHLEMTMQTPGHKYPVLETKLIFWYNLNKAYNCTYGSSTKKNTEKIWFLCPQMRLKTPFFPHNYTFTTHVQGLMSQNSKICAHQKREKKYSRHMITEFEYFERAWRRYGWEIRLPRTQFATIPSKSNGISHHAIDLVCHHTTN